VAVVPLVLPTITQTTAEILKNEAYSRKMTDDFLIDISEYDIPNIETTMELFVEPIYSEPKYYGKELLNIITTSSTMKDIFIIPPSKTRKKNKKVLVICYLE